MELSIVKYFLFLVLIIGALSVNGAPLSQKMSARKSCGLDLVERVHQICQNRGGHLRYTSPRVRRHVRRGIVNECCANKCADHQLYAYCSFQHEVNSSERAPQSLQQGTQTDFEVTDTRMPEAQSSTKSISSKNIIEETATKPVEITTEFNLFGVDRKTKNPHFQFGTVPPEYRISPFVPSQSRLLI